MRHIYVLIALAMFLFAGTASASFSPVLYEGPYTFTSPARTTIEIAGPLPLKNWMCGIAGMQSWMTSTASAAFLTIDSKGNWAVIGTGTPSQPNIFAANCVQRGQMYDLAGSATFSSTTGCGEPGGTCFEQVALANYVCLMGGFTGIVQPFDPKLNATTLSFFYDGEFIDSQVESSLGFGPVNMTGECESTSVTFPTSGFDGPILTRYFIGSPGTVTMPENAYSICTISDISGPLNQGERWGINPNTLFKGSQVLELDNCPGGTCPILSAQCITSCPSGTTGPSFNQQGIPICTPVT